MNKQCKRCGKEIINDKLGRPKKYCSEECRLKARGDFIKEWKENNKGMIREINYNYYIKNKHKIKQKHKEWEEKNKERRKAYTKNYLKNNKIKTRAHEKALRIPTKDNCENCGSIENLERHHEDYSKPLEIKTLCRRCHLILHRSHTSENKIKKSVF